MIILKLMKFYLDKVPQQVFNRSVAFLFFKVESYKDF